jgi:hypothetical protein
MIARDAILIKVQELVSQLAKMKGKKKRT